MTQADNIQRVEIEDACDGSVTVTIKFEDGSQELVNADTAPNAVAMSERKDGRLTYPALFDSETGERW